MASQLLLSLNMFQKDPDTEQVTPLVSDLVQNLLSNDCFYYRYPLFTDASEPLTISLVRHK